MQRLPQTSGTGTRGKAAEGVDIPALRAAAAIICVTDSLPLVLVFN